MNTQKNKIRVGVIGLGMGRNHIQGYKQHHGAHLVAIADMNGAKLAAAGKEFGVDNLYENPLEMIDKEKLDVVSIAVPNKYHMELTVAALENNSHVLCEKPMAMNYSEANTMLEASKRTGKRLMLNYSYRFTKAAWWLKQQIGNGELGEVYFGRTMWHRRRGIPGLYNKSYGLIQNTGPWFYNKELAGGGPLIDLGVHRIDLALWFMGFPEPAWIVGSTYNKLATELTRAQKVEYSVEDLAVGTIKFKNGATLQIEASWAANIPEKELMETRILGTKAGLIHQNINEEYKFEGKLYTEHNGALLDMHINSQCNEPANAYCHFIDAIIEDKPHIATAEEGLFTMKILDALYQSASENKPIMFA